ncbi:DUF559 domain-containing protein [Micrococcus porci]|uniref:endonuclease domain-containing protein n=1 Tax=Micrococcus porci TaxID=2856555 RepID=UPI003CF07720
MPRSLTDADRARVQGLDSPVFPLALAELAGVRGSRGRRADLRAVGRGLRARRGEEPTPAELAVAVARADRSVVVTHATAAALWGIWLPSASPQEAHVTRLRGRQRPLRAGVVGHRMTLAAEHVLEMGAGRAAWSVTSPAWTWTDLAAGGLGVEELTIAGDSLLRRPDGPRGEAALPVAHPLADLTGLRAVVEGRANLRGKRRLLAALEHTRSGSDSPMESRLRLRLVAAGVPEPELNVRVPLGPDRRTGATRWTGPRDLVWREARVVVEYEGAHHFEDADQYRRDMRRDEELRALGWVVLRVDRDVWTPQGWEVFLGRLGAALTRWSC